MSVKQSIVLVLMVGVLLTVTVGMVKWQQPTPAPSDDAWSRMPTHVAHVDHSGFFEGPFESGPAVTSKCLECHEQEAQDVMHTVHWKWEGSKVHVPGHEDTVSIGKKNLINNFCISVQSNWPKCTTCHAGYGWKDADFDFSDATHIDCLVCHDNSGQYSKSTSGNPTVGVDLLAAAKSVALPTRTNCGYCHFNGGGGDAVKHGDMDQTLYYPTEDLDVHMGRYDFDCVECHHAENHEIPGRSMSVSVEDAGKIACTDCHIEAPHDNARLNEHVSTVACQTCHIPEFAKREATKMQWDWSEAGQDLPIDNPHEYLKIKGRFRYEREVVPEYYWYNGTANRYLKGDKIDPTKVTVLNRPRGDLNDPTAKIWPFKVHRGNQIYDTNFDYILIPQTVGPGAYWDIFDWDQACRQAEPITGLKYSGEYGFADTAMYWPLSHMIAPKDRALQCTDCHGEGGRMPWKQLGYAGDPFESGGRRIGNSVAEQTEAAR